MISPIHKYINVLHIKSTLFSLFDEYLSLHSFETIKSHLQNHKIQFIITIFQILLVHLSSFSHFYGANMFYMSLYISIVSFIHHDMNISYIGINLFENSFAKS